MFSSPTGKARLRELLHGPEEGVTPTFLSSKAGAERAHTVIILILSDRSVPVCISKRAAGAEEKV